MHWFALLRSVTGQKKLAPISQPIRCKTNTNLDLVAHVFPRFRQFTWFYFRFLLALTGLFDSYWLLQVFPFLMIGRCDYFVFFFLTVLNLKVLYLRRAPLHLRFKFSILMLYSYLVVKNSFICLMKSTYLC